MTKVPFIIRSETNTHQTQIPTMVQLHALATVKWRMVVKHVDVTPRWLVVHSSINLNLNLIPSLPLPRTPDCCSGKESRRPWLSLLSWVLSLVPAAGRKPQSQRTPLHTGSLYSFVDRTSPWLVLLVQGSNWTRVTSLTARAVFLHTWSPLSWAKMSADALLKKCVFFPAYAEMCSEPLFTWECSDIANSTLETKLLYLNYICSSHCKRKLARHVQLCWETAN